MNNEKPILIRKNCSMKKYMNAVKIFLISCAIIGFGFIISNFLSMNNKADEQIHSVAIQRLPNRPSAPKRPSAPSQQHVKRTSLAQTCSGTGKSTCPQGYSCCNGICADTPISGKCP